MPHKKSSFPIPSGFTLAEILIVTVIIAIASLFLAPRFDSIIDSQNSRRTFRLISGLVQQAQDLAVVKGKNLTVQFDLDHNHAFIKGTDIRLDWPEHARVTIRPNKTPSFVTKGVVPIHVSAFGKMERFSLVINDRIHARMNPYTGLLERDAA